MCWTLWTQLVQNGGPECSSQTLIAGLWRRTIISSSLRWKHIFGFFMDMSARTLPPAIEAPQLGIMSANLTVNHPNISVWVTIEHSTVYNSHSSLRDVCQY